MNGKPLLQSHALAELRSGRLRFPPFEITLVDEEPVLNDGPRPDWILELRWADRAERFAVEFKSPATPKRLREAVAQVQAYTRPGLHPLVMAPYLDREALDGLLTEEVSGIDFSGNGVVVVPGSWLVYRTGEANVYPSSRYIKSIYRGRSSLVSWAMLLRRSFDTVSAVRREVLERGGRISLGTVSKVLMSLEEDLLVSRSDGVRLLQPEQLLDRLVKNFEPPEVGTRARFDAGDLDTVATALLSRATDRGLDIAGRGEHLYTTFPGAEQVLTVYTPDLAELTAGLDLLGTRRFGNLEVAETDDELVYVDLRDLEGFRWTSPLYAYLQLARGDKREREVAEQLRQDLLASHFTSMGRLPIEIGS